jgi:hypothetical protein
MCSLGFWENFGGSILVFILTLISGNTEHIVEAVEKQQISLGFIEGPARSREVKTVPFP